MAKIIRRLWVLTIWTVFIWVNRVRNLISDSEVTSSEKIWVFIISGIFFFLALISLTLLVGFWKKYGSGTARFAAIFGLGTSAFWFIRGVGILFASHHDFGFKFIHLGLALVSIFLGSLLYRAGDRPKSKFLNWGDRSVVR
ncbi:MAG TPA: hypothetical protein QF762_01150 [Acidimicrobiales bacterium]|nr:hypothetical protein [Acidimicrobiales bacterium]|tara:strand:+ start:108 stop:530 length:423 start_codon:yes stop_codon:yes gene_type:complete